MRRITLLVLAGLLAVAGTALLTRPADGQAQRSRDATVVDPDVHHVVFENEHVRVFEGLAAPGASSPRHTHPPMLLVSIGTFRMKFTQADGSSQIVDFRPGQTLWVDGADHSWKLLGGELHAIAVEVKSAKAKAGN